MSAWPWLVGGGLALVALASSSGGGGRPKPPVPTPDPPGPKESWVGAPPPLPVQFQAQQATNARKLWKVGAWWTEPRQAPRAWTIFAQGYLPPWAEVVTGRMWLRGKPAARFNSDNVLCGFYTGTGNVRGGAVYPMMFSNLPDCTRVPGGEALGLGVMLEARVRVDFNRLAMVEWRWRQDKPAAWAENWFFDAKAEILAVPAVVTVS